MDNSMLLVSPAPHVRQKANTRSIMLDVVIAMLPALVASVIIFGWRSLVVVSVCVLSCVLFEFLFQFFYAVRHGNDGAIAVDEE